KKAGVANAWKKWQGEMRGLKINNVPARKLQYEQNYQAWASNDDTYSWDDDLLSNIYVRALRVYDVLKNETYIREGALGIELIAQAAVLDRLLNVIESPVLTEEKRTDSAHKLAKSIEGFLK